jgi:N-acetylneuraminic acid mutarotase
MLASPRAALLTTLLFGCADRAAATSPQDAAATDATEAAVAADVVNDAPPACAPSNTLQPAPRGDGAGVVDPLTGELVIFGGDDGPTVMCIPRPSFRADVWRYDPRCDRWREVSAGEGPAARSRVAYALDTRRRRMMVFGGRSRAGSSGPYTLYRDLWALDLATDRWERLEITGGPSSRANAAAVYDPTGDALYVLGGNSSTDGTRFTPLSDLWRLDLAAGAWSRVGATGAPPARLFHAMALRDRRLTVFGGGGANAFTGPFLRDLWSFDLEGNAWTRQNVRGATDELLGRISASLVADPVGDGHLLVGGHDDGALGNRNDVLAITSDGEVSVLRAGDTLGTPGSGFCDFPADFAVTDDESPERRSAYILAEDAARGRFLAYGGKTDCGLAGDVWALERTPLRWRALRGSSEGLSCTRSGREGCSSLCQ